MTETAHTPLPEDVQEREWTLWSDQRPPNAAGEYRYRATFPFLGLTVTAEWTEKMHLCGMGYSDSEWWPLRSCHWDGYRRYITVKGLEWSPVKAYDPEETVWHGLDLLPCPFTGRPARLEPVGQFIGAPLWRSEAVYIWSPGVPKRRWTDAKAMQAAWNTRADSHHRLVEALEEARTELSITRTNIMCEINRCADPRDSRWEGVPEILKERIAKIDAAIKEAGRG